MPTAGVACRGIFGPRGFGPHSGAVRQIRKERNAADTIGHYRVEDKHERDGASQRFRRCTGNHGCRPGGTGSKKRGIHHARLFRGRPPHRSHRGTRQSTPARRAESRDHRSRSVGHIRTARRRATGAVAAPSPPWHQKTPGHGRVRDPRRHPGISRYPPASGWMRGRRRAT